MALIDMGDCWFDDEMEWTWTYDEDGNFTGGFYCPYIPKELFNPYVRVYDKDNPEGKQVLKSDLMKSAEKI
jgi:hypothetical protein